MVQTNSTLIEIRDMVAAYGTDIILKDVNLDVYKNEILAIVGGSGCGKTTLLRHMVGLRPPGAGKIVIDGIDIAGAEEGAFDTALKKIGILFQGGRFVRVHDHR